MGEKGTIRGGEQDEAIVSGDMTPMKKYKYIKKRRRVAGFLVKRPSGEFRKPGRKSAAAGLITLFAFMGAKSLVLDKQNNKITTAKNTEEVLLNPATGNKNCYNRIVTLEDGVTLRETPDTLNSKYSMPFSIPKIGRYALIHSNVAGSVKGEKAVYPAIYLVDPNKDKWLGFRKDTTLESNSENGATVTPKGIANNMEWVNASKLITESKELLQIDSKATPYIRAYVVPGSTNTNTIAPCSITNEGNVVLDNRPTAFSDDYRNTGDFVYAKQAEGTALKEVPLW